MYWLIWPFILLSIPVSGYEIVFNTDGEFGRYFDGIGAISGGGVIAATSKLLPNYDNATVYKILEYLFKPQYGASLNILKVEIGGDSQSTEGTEASHMHTSTDLDCSRGYEGWLINAAKKINPDLIIHGLPWSFPGWLGTNQDPYQVPERTANYVCNWIKCINSTYNVIINFIGIWNERPYNTDYIKTLRRVLDESGFRETKIVASDNDWNIAYDMSRDEALAQNVYAIGAHYPGTHSTNFSKSLGVRLWASEDYSTYNDDVGAGCLARILNQNYVNGLITSTITWNLVTSYFDGFPYPRCSLMTANEPWSGHYSVNGPVWISAHTTQFVKPGWQYLRHSEGVGYLEKGGSYVSLISPNKKDLTIIIETMSRDHSACIRPYLPYYSVEPQNISIVLRGQYVDHINYLHVWTSQLRFENNEKSDYFIYLGKRPVISGIINLHVEVDQLVTLSTVDNKQPSNPNPPQSVPLPLPYTDNFEPKPPAYIREPEYLTAQVGYFEIIKSNLTDSGYVLQQMVLERPIDWCSTSQSPITLMGDSKTWKNMVVEVSGYIPVINGSDSLFIAGRVKDGGCDVTTTSGIFAWLDFTNQQYQITLDMMGSRIISSGPIELKRNTWYHMKLSMKDLNINFHLDGKMLIQFTGVEINNAGLVGFGAGNFGYSNFMSFGVNKIDES